ncbi:DUF1156 domain-containing protein [Chitinophagaceae bacterium LB-8]|uniref:DUF1156 domain-containing protein n=1 Tax=Paraflavisolibacter caeni TaxID=2982496 RepID=A0A9X2XVZ3_9BACT|nr:anti-phage-associated DUF1156 domain-containing protein [Paraflavisolibacter caeni]MCU7550399.1 DUF1156 domain-containing protein [Paraflavisolibacter caeni]
MINEQDAELTAMPSITSANDGSKPIKSFIESQFPVSKVSKESYKERMANNGQTLTGLGKWWGRKPLILVRAVILGLLMPASNDPKKDREIFLKILTMDDEGLWLRKEKSPSVEEYFQLAKKAGLTRYFNQVSMPDGKIKLTWDKSFSVDEILAIQRKLFKQLGYDDRLKYCIRPEHVDNLPISEWNFINSHLGTTATSLQELVEQLGKKQFGHKPRVGDSFCGGGSIPFEAARIGCDAFGSDLNPVAALLSWAALNIIGGGGEVVHEVQTAQEEVYKAADKQITDWGIEHNEQGWRADAYLYCVEAVCPITGYRIPLAPSWVIGEKSKTIAKLVRNEASNSYDIEIHSGVSDAEMQFARDSGTVQGNYMVNPDDSDIRTSMQVLRGDKTKDKESVFGLRLWENADVVPKPEDVFQERLYCIRYVETYYEKKIQQNGKSIWVELSKEELIKVQDLSSLKQEGTIREKTRKIYIAPNKDDLKREKIVLDLLKDRFAQWQQNGYIPSIKIEPGTETTRLQRERGWTYWHHLFTPRQLLLYGTFFELLDAFPLKDSVRKCLVSIGRMINWGSKLSRWDSSIANERPTDTFSNLALNTLQNYAVRAFTYMNTSWFITPDRSWFIEKKNDVINTLDVRAISDNCDFWITDPPYADAVNYHELADFFLSWYEKFIPKYFPEWYADGKKALAIRGEGEDFKKGMVDAYTNLAKNMPDNGAQIVMFTHQNSAVWADLALILWASGLQVSAAWTISTETDSAFKTGNYVKGTVCMVLRKQTTEEETFINDVYPEVEYHVTEQLKEMIALDDKEDPNFSDSDYQLAAYAAALRVLTSYRKIHPIDVQYELTKPRKKGEKNEVEKLIDKAVEIATNYLVPEGLDKDLWITLTPEEKFYLKGLEVETHGEYRNGVYQEFARGFGIKEYKNLLSTGKANETRLRSALEFKNKGLTDEGFGASMLRKVLFAVHETHVKEDPKEGRNYLKGELQKEYWSRRQKLITVTRYIQNLGSRIEHWQDDAKAANLLAGSLENDHV